MSEAVSPDLGGRASPVEVVAGILVEDGAVLVAQRSPTQSFPLQWEFPGGKVEAGETPPAALVREFEEELGVRVEPGLSYGTIQYAGGDGRVVRVTFYLVRRMKGEPRPLQVKEVSWVDAVALSGVNFIPANRVIVERLRADLDLGLF